MVVWKRFRLRKWSPKSAYSWSCTYKPWVYEGERKAERKENFPYHTYCEKQQGAGSKITATWKSHKHVITLESIIPLVTRFWGETRILRLRSAVGKAYTCWYTTPHVLYQHRFLRPNSHSSAFFEIYKIQYPLHRSKPKISQNLQKRFQFLVKFWEFLVERMFDFNWENV